MHINYTGKTKSKTNANPPPPPQKNQQIHTMTARVYLMFPSDQAEWDGRRRAHMVAFPLHKQMDKRWNKINVKLLLRGWYQASDQQVWRSVGLLHGSNLPATQQQGGQTTHLRLCIRHCELPSFFPRPLSEHTPSQKLRLIV